jgi:hypothetical protein
VTVRVVQWATGSVGIAAIKGVLAHPELELAGCWVHSPDKVGRDVGEIIGTAPLGIIATNCVNEAPAGIQSFFDLPLITGRAATGLAS